MHTPREVRQNEGKTLAVRVVAPGESRPREDQFPLPPHVPKLAGKPQSPMFELEHAPASPQPDAAGDAAGSHNCAWPPVQDAWQAEETVLPPP